MELSLLGPLEVRWRGEALRFATSATRALLAYLAVESDRPHPRERLAALFWPDQPQATAGANLRQTIARLRRALPGPPAPPALRITSQMIQLDRGGLQLDLERFAALLAMCAAHPHPDLARCLDCRPYLREVAGLYRGELLSDLSLRLSQPFEEWLLLKREWAHQQALGAFATLARGAELEGDYAALRLWAERQLELEPWREDAHAQLIRALVAVGQRPAALAQYARCCRILREELGASPSAALVALVEQIRSGQPILPAGRAGPGPVAAMQTAERGPHGRAAIPAAPTLFGRADASAQLKRWLLGGRCGVVAVVGMGGIGKTSLVASVAHSVAPQFDAVAWLSLVNAPPPLDTLQTLIDCLAEQSPLDFPERIEEHLALLSRTLGRRRCLVVLDNLESLLEAGPSRAFRPGFEAYGPLISLFASGAQGSALLITSRELPAGLRGPVAAATHTLQLQGLDEGAGAALLAACGLRDPLTARPLVDHYSGNPLALRLVGQTVAELFAGDVEAFLAAEAPIFADIRTVLDEQWGRLSDHEREIMRWLAVAREPLTLPALRALLVQPPTPHATLEALRALQQRSLAEQIAATAGGGPAFTLQNVILEYVTERLVEAAGDELAGDELRLVNRLALLQAQAPPYVQERQAHQLLRPVAERLLGRLGRPALEARARHHLERLRASGPLRPGYAAGNILNLLLQLGATPADFDFAGLCVWGAALRGRVVQGISFARADLSRSSFTDTFGVVQAVALSPDGRWLAAAGDDGLVRLWRPGSGHLVATYDGHRAGVKGVAFHPGGALAVSASRDHTVHLWEVATCQLVRRMAGHAGEVFVVALSPDGALAASGGQDAEVRLWSLADGTCRNVLRGHTASVAALAFSPDGRALASGSDDGVVRLWAVGDGATLAELRGHTGFISGVAFTADGRTLVSGGADRTIRLWEAASGRLERLLEGEPGWVTALALSPDGAELISANVDGTVRARELASGQGLVIFRGHSNEVRALALSADGRLLASAGHDHTVRLWDRRGGRGLAVIQGYTQATWAVCISPDGRLLASAGADGAIHLWDVASGRCVRTLYGHSGWVTGLAFGAGQGMLASRGMDRTLRLWELPSGRLRHTARAAIAEATGVEFSPDGALVASGFGAGAIGVWEAASGRLRQEIPGHTEWVTGVAFSPGGRLLASSSMDGTVGVWDLAGGERLLTLAGHGDFVWSVAFSPDGGRIASGGQDGTVRIWDAATGRLDRVLEGDGGRVLSVRYSPDGLLLAAGGGDRAVRVWDSASGRSVHALEGHAGWVPSIAFSPDGRLLASGSDDRTCRLWAVDDGALRRILRPAGPYEGMDITGAAGVTLAQRATLLALGAHDADA